MAASLDLIPVGAEMEEAVAALALARDTLADDEAVMGEGDRRRLAPGRVGEVDEPGRLALRHRIAEIDMRLEEPGIGGVDVVVGAADAQQPRLRRRLGGERTAQHAEMIKQPRDAGLG